ncbi:hypothetical protein CRUP_006882 [Coryphaenoides rupestris]|nr:hypothetical protein CRUP_006882 [Coryphaenoides rupestris]
MWRMTLRVTPPRATGGRCCAAVRSSDHWGRCCAAVRSSDHWGRCCAAVRSPGHWGAVLSTTPPPTGPGRSLLQHNTAPYWPGEQLTAAQHRPLLVRGGAYCSTTPPPTGGQGRSLLQHNTAPYWWFRGASGLFAELLCPGKPRGVCGRPHCPYRHGGPGELQRGPEELLRGAASNISCNTGGYTPTLRRAPKLPSQTRKYVVDNSKPRTDLEYDPLSNFSADLRSYSSSGKDQKAKAAFKRVRDHPRDHPCGPALEDDLTEEGDLIIDIPSSPYLKKSRVHDVTEHQPEQRPPHVSVTTTTTPPQTSSSEVSQSDASTVTPMESDQTLERGRAQMQPPANTHAAQHYWSPADSVPSVLPRGQSYAHGLADPPPPLANSGVDHSFPLYTPSTLNVQSRLQSPPPAPPSPPRPTEPPSARAQSPSGGGNVITIGSSSEEESDAENLNYSDMDVSDSDPMEECYRIFMEANEAENEAFVPDAQVPDAQVPDAQVPEAQAPATGNVLTPPHPVMCQVAAVDTPEVEEKPLALPAQKRVAHIPRRPEPGAVLRPQPQVLLVPLRGGGHHPPAAPKVQLVPQRATPLPALLKGGQIVSSALHRRPDAGPPAPPPPPPPTLSHAHPPISLQNTYMSCIPVGKTVIQVGNNLHFILQEGSGPLVGSATSLSTVLTPIGMVNSSAGSSPALPAFQLSAVTPVHRYRPGHPVPVPVHVVGNVTPLPSGVSCPPGGASGGGSAPTAPPGPPRAVQVPAKPLTKRKAKQRAERVKDKVPHDVRQRYVNMFTEELLKSCPTVKDAFEKHCSEGTQRQRVRTGDGWRTVYRPPPPQATPTHPSLCRTVR